MSPTDVDDAPEPTKVVALGNGTTRNGRKTALLKFMWVRNWLKGLQEAQ